MLLMTASDALSRSLLPSPPADIEANGAAARPASPTARSSSRPLLLLVCLCLAAGLLVVMWRQRSFSPADEQTAAAPALSAAASAPAPVVRTAQGLVRGRQLPSSAATPLYLFQGIPFAAPPVGALRWREPQPPAAWSGQRDCTDFAPVCLQFGGDGVVGSEDCLYLNVWTRNVNASQPVPVMWYVHGGSSINGDSHAYMLDLVADRNVVVVTVAYRLAVMGYLALDVLTANQLNATGVATSGNYGVLDNVAALQWTRDNIAAFGGDPTLVTIFGQSTGGTNVMALIISPLTDGLFQAAISWSGSPVLKGGLSEASDANAVFLTNSNCTAGGDTAAQLACIQALSAEDAQRSGPWENGAHWGDSSDFGFPSFTVPDAAVMIVDGYVVAEEMNAALQHSKKDITLVYGHMRTEIDGGPADVRQYSTQPAFAQWLQCDILSQGWNDSVAAAVIAEYPISEQGGDPQLTYELIVNDITFCGGVDNMRHAASPFSAITVHHYLNAAHPTPPCALGGPGGWVTHWSPHGWDMAVFLSTTSGFYNETEDDRRLRELMRQLWVDGLAAGLGIDESLWPQVGSNGGDGGDVVSVVLTQEAARPIIVEGMRKKKCAFWKQLGFGDRGWAN